jgi:aspartyl-tRNA(Asn)/glutamyl-tRNA(Gln) amidotransferase subunit C
MSLSLEEVEHIAALARLRLTAEEKERYRQQLSAVLDYMAKLKQVDTAHIEPTATVLPLHTILRPDDVTPSLTTDELLANAPAAEAGLFRVPPVLE